MENIKDVSFPKLMQYGESFLDAVVVFVGNAIVAGLIIFFGFKIAKFVANWVKKLLLKNNYIDEGVVRFLYSFTDLGLKAFVIFTAVGKLGVESSSIIALFGSATVAIGLALQGSLSNIAGGVLILILKPFQIGDYIIEDNSKNEGTVCDIDLFYTKLKTVDNKTVVIPNGVISNTSLTNVTRQDFRRVDLIIGISYDQAIGQVKDILERIVRGQDMVIIEEEKPLQIFVHNFAESCVEIGLRFWVPMDEYWKIRWDVLEKIKNEFDKYGIEIPYNKLDVQIKREV